ncbi:MAG: hypothetical protein NVSMB2_27860 [Chloroflexota bacterium]
MSPDELAHTIQLILAPVVMISACALTLNGVMSHFQAVSSRLRALTHERLELVHGKKDDDDSLARDRLDQIDHEASELLRRHGLIHNSMMAIDSAMAVFVLCMLTIAIVSVSGWSTLAVGVLALFVLGTLLLLAGLVFSAIDIALSRRAVAFEVRRVLQLTRKP